MAPAEPEDAKAPAVERPELETGAEGEGDEAGAEDEQKPEARDVLQVAPQLATPAKFPPAALDVKACSKSPPAKAMRVRSPGDTPSRDEVLRQNAADRMAGVEDDAAKWAVVVAVPRPEEVREPSAAEESEQEEAARLVRRGPPASSSLKTRTLHYEHLAFIQRV